MGFEACIRNGPEERGQEQGSHPRATTTNRKSGTSFCSWLRQGKLRLCQTAHLLQTTPNGKTHKPYSNWERIYYFHSLSVKSLCQTGTLVIMSSSTAFFFFSWKAKVAAVFAGIINRGTLQLLVWQKTGLQPETWLRKARTRSHIRLRHIQASATCSLLLCLAAKHLSSSSDCWALSTIFSCSPCLALLWLCTQLMDGTEEFNQPNQGFLVISVSRLRFTIKPQKHLYWPRRVWGCFSGNYILECNHMWSPQNMFLKFSHPPVESWQLVLCFLDYN